MRGGGPGDDDEFVLDDLEDDDIADGDLELDDELEEGMDESSGAADEDAGDPEEDELFDGDVDADTSVSCPYCGETTQISLDYGSGAAQEYVEDCEVCCRPWRVRVRYDRRGTAEVTIDPA